MVKSENVPSRRSCSPAAVPMPAMVAAEGRCVEEKKRGENVRVCVVRRTDNSQREGSKDLDRRKVAE